MKPLRSDKLPYVFREIDPESWLKGSLRIAVGEAVQGTKGEAAPTLEENE